MDGSPTLVFVPARHDLPVRVQAWRVSVAVLCLRCPTPTVWLVSNEQPTSKCPSCGQEVALGGLEWDAETGHVDVRLGQPEAPQLPLIVGVQ